MLHPRSLAVDLKPSSICIEHAIMRYSSNTVAYPDQHESLVAEETIV